MSELPLIYVAAGDTAKNPSRSGIQTTVRRLVAELGNHHANRVRLVCWNHRATFLHPLPPEVSLGSASEPLRRASPLSRKQKFAAFPGWLPGRLDHGIPLHRHPLHAAKLRGAWLLLPELLYGRQRLERFVSYARRYGMRIAAIFYDAVFLEHPELFPPDLFELHRDYLRGLSKFDLVLTISETSKSYWHKYVAREGVEEPSIKVVPLAAELAGVPRVLDPRTDGTDTVRALCVSTAEPRKNLRGLCAALEQIASSLGTLPFEMDLVGAQDPNAPALAALLTSTEQRLAGRFRWHRWVDTAGLREFYAKCDFTVYPSVMEGFGLPILESLWLARPCICANFGIMAENARPGGCLTVDVRDPSALAATMLQLATDSELRNRLAGEATLRPMRTWRTYAADIVQALDES